LRGTPIIENKQDKHHHGKMQVKEIEAIIRPHTAEDVREPLLEAGVRGMTISEICSIGDGKIFILPVEEAIRVRTQEHGEEAL
jgi:nitrogen regulatory protein PII